MENRIKDEVYALALEAVLEMKHMTAMEIRELQKDWVAEVQRLGLSGRAIGYCNELCQLAIGQKMEDSFFRRC